MKLDIAPDGKSGELEYYGGAGRKKVTVTDGLKLDPSTAGRVKGTLKTEVPEVGTEKIPVYSRDGSIRSHGRRTPGT